MKIPKNIYILIWCVFAVLIFVYDLIIFFIQRESGEIYPKEYILIMIIFIGYIFLYFRNSE
jgi:hypothetical protein